MEQAVLGPLAFARWAGESWVSSVSPVCLAFDIEVLGLGRGCFGVLLLLLLGLDLLLVFLFLVSEACYLHLRKEKLTGVSMSERICGE